MRLSELTMAKPPLSHHDIVKMTAPMSRAGYKVNLARCDRNERYIEFESTMGSTADITSVFCLELHTDQDLLVRVVMHSSGLVSTLRAKFNDLEQMLNCFEQVPTARQISADHIAVVARSYTLAPNLKSSETKPDIRLNFVCAHVANLELRVDISASGGMPADARLLAVGTASTNLREILADETELPLDHRAALALRQQSMSKPINNKLSGYPDDLLAVLGTQWRPLRFQGDHWKCLLRQLGKGNSRSSLAEKHVEQAVQHLYNTVQRGSSHYHRDNKKARWQVFFRRLQPIMVLLGMLSIMPISWFLVSTGTMSINPLALSITPLLMVGAIVLTAREVPVMEIPSTPRDLPSMSWSSTNTIDVNSTAISKQ